MAKVMLDNQSLIDIGNAIREINGATVSYKPREMAPAIDAIPELTRDVHSYRITINQTPHQTISVHKYLDDKEITYSGSFNVSEVFYKITVSIEAEEGWQAGTLNKSGVIVVDRDMVIEASPATEVGT